MIPLKVPLVVGLALAQGAALVPPVPAFYEVEEQPDSRASSSRNAVSRVLKLSQLVVLCSTTAGLARSYRIQENSGTLTWLSGIGIAATCSGAVIRTYAKRALREQAEFPLVPHAHPRLLHIPTAHQPMSEQDAQRSPWSLSSTHALVTTGPYGIVRHPMYTSVLLGLAGTGLFYATPASPFRILLHQALEFTKPHLAYDGLSRTFGRIGHVVARFANRVPWELLAAGAFGLGVVYVAVHLRRLAEMEDGALEARFGKRWQLYRWMVSFVFIPGFV